MVKKIHPHRTPHYMGDVGVSKNIQMAIAQNRYLFYESTNTIGDDTFYTYRIMLVDDTLLLLYKLLGDEGPIELDLLNVPILVPATIEENEEFSVYGGSSTWLAPEDMYFLYAKGNPHSIGVYPTAPDEEDITVATTFFDRPQIVYSARTVEVIENWPAGDSPDETDPDESGWSFPDYAEFGYAQKGIATRYLSPFFYTDVEADKLWTYGGCTDYEGDEDHFLNNLPPDDFQTHTIFRWTTNPYLVYNCHESDPGYSYLVERTGSNPEHVSIWMFESDTPAYYYPSIPVSLPTFDIIPVGISLFLVAPQLFEKFTGIAALFKHIHTGCLPRYRGMVSNQTGYKGMATQVDSAWVGICSKL